MLHFEWMRMAGSKRAHVADRSTWVRSGRAVCGANLGRPYVTYGENTPEPEYFQRLADYPKRWGKVKPCAHCTKAVANAAR